MSAGPLNMRCTFKRDARPRNAAGDIVVAFANIVGMVRVPCHYRPERGWERNEAGRNESAEMGTLKIRSCEAARAIVASDVVVIHSVSGDDANYVVKYIDNRDRHDRFLYMQVERGTAQR